MPAKPPSARPASKLGNARARMPRVPSVGAGETEDTNEEEKKKGRIAGPRRITPNLGYQSKASMRSLRGHVGATPFY